MKFLIFNPPRAAIVVAMSLNGTLRLAALLLPLAAIAALAQDVPPAPSAGGAGEPATAPATPAVPATPASDTVRPVETWLEAQVELARRGFSGGSIDGVHGPQSVAALRAFQRAAGIEDTGTLDQPTRESLLLTAPALSEHTISAEEKASVRPLPATWLGKSEQPSLTFATVLELVAERFHASPRFLQRLNPDVNWDDLLPGVVVKVPAVERASVTGHAARLHVRLADHELEATDDSGTVIAHFPVSIARNVDKRPVGELHVVVVIPDPNYTFDPEVFPEVPEGRELGRKLVIPPGPNNPVGVAWIGLDRTGYGIHGTPDPEKVGRTESHGCFRLANWDARTLLDLAWVGMPVVVEP
ncbi:MAG TPA: L,D-transpeptidase [Lacunisphaera sp.]|nr:L,D-transpeptidase [Lacunisphaera sp.]